jgi:ABC-type lipoprotein export system ATPase subunit
MSAIPAADPVVEAIDLSRTYRRGTELVHALRSVRFTLSRGEMVAVVGPSGAGKTTLLNLLGCLDVATSGSLKIAGREVASLNDGELTRLRRDELGFVFQHFGLVPTLTVAENIALPCLFSRRKSQQRVEELLQKVGLTGRRSHRPNQLSGGEMQRTAIARALVNEPKILLADEPTGNLDSATGDAIAALFRQLASDGLTVVVVTHNMALAESTDRTLALRDGTLITGDA